MHPLLLLVPLALLDPSDALPAGPSRLERRARWLPTVTLRFTHRASSAWWASSPQEALTVPLGTTFEVVMEWGAAGSSIER